MNLCTHEAHSILNRNTHVFFAFSSRVDSTLWTFLELWSIIKVGVGNYGLKWDMLFRDDTAWKAAERNSVTEHLKPQGRQVPDSTPFRSTSFSILHTPDKSSFQNAPPSHLLSFIAVFPDRLCFPADMSITPQLTQGC